MLELIRTQCFELLDKNQDFADPSDIIIQMEGDEHVLTALNSAILEDYENTKYAVTAKASDPVISVEQVKEALKKGESYTTFIIPFLCTINFKLNPEIRGYILTKIK